MKNILVSGFSDKYLLEVIKVVRKECKVFQLVYSSKSKFARAGDSFVEDLIRSDILLSKFSNHFKDPVAYQAHPEYKESLIFFLNTIDRVYIKPVSNNELVEYFNYLLDYWTNYLKRNSITVVFFQSSPHFPWDIALFFALRFLNIDLFILRRTLISNCVVFDRDFRYLHHNLFKFKNHFEGCYEFSEIKEIYTSQSSWIDYSKKILADSKNRRNGNYLFGFLTYKKLLISPIYLIKDLFTSRKNYFRLDFFDYFFYLASRFFQQRELNHIWRSISEKELPKKGKFIYFPLHFQPERTTDPECEFFSKQLSAIKILLNMFPNDWKIIVKEHPRQNRPEYPNLRRYHFRSQAFYKSIKSLNRLILLSTEIDSKNIIAISKLTASCTGSVLWESLIAGKPSISFGSHWHISCRSSPHISELIGNNKALINLINKDKSDVLKDIEFFLSENREAFVKASNSELFLTDKGFRATSVKNLSKSIIEISNKCLSNY